MSFKRSFELSNQDLAGLSEDQAPPEAAFHAPLLDLETDAPTLNSLRYSNKGVRYAFSNDECTAPYFDQLQVRALTPEYQAAAHQVAIVIGESALAANLPFIPEETIIVLDKSPDICVYMQTYVDGLRTASTIDEWLEHLLMIGPSHALSLIRYQAEEWERAGYAHPLVDEGAFAAARAKANEKTIIAWCADIAKPEEMNALGEALRSRDAVVTMMNLTNVLPYIETLQTAAECAAQLSPLPVSSQAPILTASLGRTDPQAEKGNLQTGPFFGLDNLARAGDRDDRHPLGAIARRSVSFEMGEDTGRRRAEEVLDILIAYVLSQDEVWGFQKEDD